MEINISRFIDSIFSACGRDWSVSDLLRANRMIIDMLDGCDRSQKNEATFYPESAESVRRVLLPYAWNVAMKKEYAFSGAVQLWIKQCFGRSQARAFESGYDNLTGRRPIEWSFVDIIVAAQSQLAATRIKESIASFVPDEKLGWPHSYLDAHVIEDCHRDLTALMYASKTQRRDHCCHISQAPTYNDPSIYFINEEATKRIAPDASDCQGAFVRQDTWIIDWLWVPQYFDDPAMEAVFRSGAYYRNCSKNSRVQFSLSLPTIVIVPRHASKVENVDELMVCAQKIASEKPSCFKMDKNAIGSLCDRINRDANFITCCAVASISVPTEWNVEISHSRLVAQIKDARIGSLLVSGMFDVITEKGACALVHYDGFKTGSNGHYYLDYPMFDFLYGYSDWGYTESVRSYPDRDVRAAVYDKCRWSHVEVMASHSYGPHDEDDETQKEWYAKKPINPLHDLTRAFIDGQLSEFWNR